MASKRIQGITIEIGGDTTKLQTALKGVDSQLKSTESALRDVDKLLKLNPGNVTLLTQKQKGLTSAIEETKKRLETLKQASKEAMTPEQQDALQREIIETQNKLESLTKEMKNFGSVGQQQVVAVGEKLSSFGTKLTGIGKKMTTYVTLPIVAGFTAAANAASDYDENINKLEVAFGKYAKDVRSFTDNALDQFGLSKLAASEAAASFGALAKGMGLSDRKAATLSKELTGLSADLASYFNLSNEDAASALEGIFTGQTQSLKKLGVVMTQVNLEDFAAKQGKVYKEMSEGEKVLLRYEYVLDRTKDAHGDYARTSDGTANSIKTFKSAIQDLGTTFGQVILPIITPVIQKITELIKKISALPEPIKKIIVIGGMVVAAIGPILTSVGSLITAVGTLMKLAPALVLAAKPLLIGGAIVVGIVAATALIIKNWDKIKAAGIAVGKAVTQGWNAMVNGIKSGVQAFVQFGVNGFNNLRNGAINVVQSMRQGITSAFDNIKSRIRETVDSIKNWIIDKFTAAKDGVVSIWNKVTTALKKPVNAIITMINGLLTGLEAMLNWIINGLNKIQFNIPEWVPGIGGKRFGINIANVAFGRINYLANGGSIGEGQHAIVGENAPEYLRVQNGRAIVTPLAQTRNSTENITINVYARPGQDVRALAKEIKTVLVREQQQRSAVYA